MQPTNLPSQTLRDLGVILVVAAELAWHGTRTLLIQLKPLVSPPADLEVRSSRGATYTGLLLIEHNDVLAGAVVRIADGATPSSDEGDPALFTTRRRAPFVTPPPTPGAFESRLPGWADDPRSLDEEEDPWRYRR